MHYANTSFRAEFAQRFDVDSGKLCCMECGVLLPFVRTLTAIEPRPAVRLAADLSHHSNSQPHSTASMVVSWFHLLQVSDQQLMCQFSVESVSAHEMFCEGSIEWVCNAACDSIMSVQENVVQVSFCDAIDHQSDNRCQSRCAYHSILLCVLAMVAHSPFRPSSEQ